MRITKEDTIGLVIDIQDRLFSVMHEKEKLLKNCQILIQGLNELDIPLTVTQQYTKGLGDTVPELSSIIPNFKYFEKNDFSCYDVADFKWKLDDYETKNIIICGIESHVCVLQTAVDLKEAGLNPIVVMDCIASRTRENWKLAKERFRSEEIMMASYESILFELTRSAGGLVFKAISNLVK